jgi:acetoin utilization deacetylase AcuC-like enzyme
MTFNAFTFAFRTRRESPPNPTTSAPAGAKTIGAAVMDKKVQCGFALVRPPGHHAMRVMHGARGFCNINIEAIMIEYLRQAYGIRRVAIIDTDCHHGDGTQDIYWNDPDTLFISLHQDGRTLYPGSGFTSEIGGVNALGTTLNFPLPPRTGPSGFLYAVNEVIRPILDEFRPELVVNSAGQDNHYSDPLSNMNFTAQGYADLTAALKPDIAVLEGGYSIEGALPYVNVGIILALAGIDYSRVREPDLDRRRLVQTDAVSETIRDTGEVLLGLWRSRHRLTATLPDQELFQRRRTIFYDTDNIVEKQEETVRRCRDCAGALRIDSGSDRQVRILGVHVPQRACPACQGIGRRWYETAEATTYDHIYLQDLSRDCYLARRDTLTTGDRY